MIIARSLWRKLFVTIVAAAAFVSLLEVTMLDSQNLPWLRPGVAAQLGVAASDPTLLPLGSIVEIDAPDTKYDGIYSILDTGPEIKGREIDLYMWSCYEALDFGRRDVRLTVLRLGWNPHATTPGFMERLFRRPGVTPTVPEPLPSRPLPILSSGTKN